MLNNNAIINQLIDYYPPRAIRRRKIKNLFKLFLTKDNLFFDIGANRGEMTEIALILGANCVDVEPQEKWCSVLSKKFSNSHVTILHKGLSDQSGYLSFYQNDNNAVSTFSEKFIAKSRYAGTYTHNPLSIEVTTLDNLITSFGIPNFIKIDVEGYEYNVLKGLTHTVNCICFEFTKEILDETDKCLDYLNTLNMKAFNISLYNNFKLFFNEWISSQELLTFLRTESDPLLHGDIFCKPCEKR